MPENFMLMLFADEWGNEDEDDPLLDEELDDYEDADTEDNDGDRKE